VWPNAVRVLAQKCELAQASRPIRHGGIDSSEIFVSAASIWEISIKSALGKLEADPDEVKAPFDRLLVAQARFEPMILLTDDDVLGGYGEFVEVV
jgi:PIN domain nuclease of toxin-antitoxin system